LRFSLFLPRKNSGKQQKSSGRFGVISALDPLKVQDSWGE
jgi:hypothetical protein